MSQGTTIAIPQPSRVKLATWIGLFLALFSMIIIRDAFRAFAPNAGPRLNLLKECLMFSSAGTVLWLLKRRGLRRTAAIVLPLVIFSVGHWTGGAANILIAFASGATLTAFYLWRKDLVANMIGHFLVDFVPNVLPRLAGA